MGPDVDNRNAWAKGGVQGKQQRMAYQTTFNQLGKTQATQPDSNADLNKLESNSLEQIKSPKSIYSTAIDNKETVIGGTKTDLLSHKQGDKITQ